MKIRLRPISEPFAVFLRQARQVCGFWARFLAGAIVVSLIFGQFGPLGFVAILLTFGLPILLLVLWGRALDAELGWGEIDNGPW